MKGLLMWLVVVPVAAALLSVPASNIIQSETVDFDNAQNAWTLQFESLPEHTHVIVQVCEADCSSDDNTRTERYPSLDCSGLRAKVQEAGWMHAGVSEHSCIPAGQDMNLTDVFTEVFPNAIKIANKLEQLKPYGVFINDTLTIRLRVLFVLDYKEETDETQRTYTVHEYRETLSLKTPTLLYGTVVLSHECPERGLFTPPRSTLQLLSWNDIQDPGKMPCVWKCREDHVRYPFHSFPPSIDDANRSRFVCQPLPADFTAVQFKFSVYLQSSSVVNGEYTKEFFEAVDSLADEMQANMQSQFDAAVLVVLMVQGTIFGHEYDNDLNTMMQRHAAFTNRLQSGEWESIKLVPSRRLLQSEVELSGVTIVADTSISDLAGLRRSVSTEADLSLQNFAWSEELGVESTDTAVVVTHLQRALKTPAPAESFFNDSFFSIFLLACGGLVTIKLLLNPFLVQEKYHAKR